jgi:hypothetical protein
MRGIGIQILAISIALALFGTIFNHNQVCLKILTGQFVTSVLIEVLSAPPEPDKQ